MEFHSLSHCHHITIIACYPYCAIRDQFCKAEENKALKARSSSREEGNKKKENRRKKINVKGASQRWAQSCFCVLVASG